MRKPAFVMFGIGGVYNYGCEAIVRGTVEILRQVSPDSHVRYLSQRPTEDAAALSDCAVQVVGWQQRARWHPLHICRGTLRRIGAPYRWIPPARLSCFHKDDCALWIGGDTPDIGLGPFRSDQTVAHFDLPRAIARRSAGLVIWATSVTPCPGAAEAYRSLLKRATLVTAREPLTHRYLSDLAGHDKVKSVADPAFLMPAASVNGDFPWTDHAKPTLAVNLSPLSVRTAYGPNGMAGALQEQTDFVATMMRKLDVRVVLVPHVVAPHTEGDDDCRYLARMHERLRAACPEPDAVTVLPGGLGARRTKGVIGQCDALVAARMHCAIAGVSSGVPTLFVSYSSKAKGMAQYVYGDLQWHIGLTELPAASTIEKIALLLERRSAVREYLRDSANQFHEDAFRGGAFLAECLQGQDVCGK
ncbi:MAG: polysaccharide pyruvyl transferase family protein [Candidatus Brocadiaceae bacterium]|nr:polysaccharide pyruvyl transferase family protein [Candidatus Brocadiaceae bacterium]